MKEKIRKFVGENWFKVGLLVILIISIAGAFYWFEWKPNQIKKECYQQTIAKENYPNRGQNTYTSEERRNIELNYQDCLRQYGLEK